MTDFVWGLAGRCYRLGLHVQHAGVDMPDRLITAR